MAYFAQETIALILIDSHNFAQQVEVVPTLRCDRMERFDVLGKARASISNTRIQESRADPAIGTDSRAYLINVCSHRLRNVGYRVDEGDLHRQKCVGSVFDQFRALRVG